MTRGVPDTSINVGTVPVVLLGNGETAFPYSCVNQSCNGTFASCAVDVYHLGEFVPEFFVVQLFGDDECKV